MCQNASWYEQDKDVYFLTDADLASDRGQELKKHLGNQYENDKVGHGAIAWFYEVDYDFGIKKECTDFSTPDNFPLELVTAIKEGKRTQFGVVFDILTPEAWEKYNKIIQEARENYKKIQQEVYKKYEKIEQEARENYLKINREEYEKYEKIEQEARENYLKINREEYEKYEKIDQEARENYNKIEQEAWRNYLKIDQEAWKNYYKIVQPVFWEIALQKENRKKEWE